MRIGSHLLLASLWLLGCDKSLLDQLTSGGGCSAEDSVAGVRGQCPNNVLACELGSFDRDGMPSNGCESLLPSSGEYSLFAMDTTGVAVMVINEYQMTATAIGGWVAIAGPACDGTPSTPCHYDLLALQIGLSEFIFDSLSWADGLIELPKPMPVTDNGDGLIIPEGSTFTASFVIEGKKRVVSQGTTRGSLRLSSNGTRVNVLVGNDLRLPFGGYTVEGMSIIDNGGLVAP